MTETFTEYLMGKCIESKHPLDDMLHRCKPLSDVYEEWIDAQDVRDVIYWAEKWGELEALKGQRKAWKEAEKIINEFAEKAKEILA